MGILLVEPAIVPDVFVSGIAEPEDLGDGNIRFTAYAQQKSFNDYVGATEYVIVSRIIMPVPAVFQSLRQTMKVLGWGNGRANLLKWVN